MKPPYIRHQPFNDARAIENGIILAGFAVQIVCTTIDRPAFGPGSDATRVLAASLLLVSFAMSVSAARRTIQRPIPVALPLKAAAVFNFMLALVYAASQFDTAPAALLIAIALFGFVIYASALGNAIQAAALRRVVLDGWSGANNQTTLEAQAIEPIKAGEMVTLRIVDGKPYAERSASAAARELEQEREA